MVADPRVTRVPIQAEAVVVIPPAADVCRRERHPPAPAGRDVGRAGFVVGVEVLPDQRRLIPAALEPGRDRRSVVEHDERAVRPFVVVDPRGVRVRALQDRGSARTAERIDDERVREVHAVSHQHRLHVRHHRQGVPALVVGQDQHDVRASRRRRRRRRRDGEPDPREGGVELAARVADTRTDRVLAGGAGEREGPGRREGVRCAECSGERHERPPRAVGSEPEPRDAIADRHVDARHADVIAGIPEIVKGPGA